MSPGGPADALNEHAGAQAHFIDLCRVLGVPEPASRATPAGLRPAVRAHAEAIARAAKALVDLRERWLNAPEWTERVPDLRRLLAPNRTRAGG